MRLSRLRDIMSALPMNMHELPPLRNQYTRACSRKRPTMECTVMFSLTPGRSGQQAADAAHDEPHLHARHGRHVQARG